MKAHVFYYRWPGIKEGLVHEIQELNWPEVLKAPLGAYIFTNSWYWRNQQRKPTGGLQTVTTPIDPEKVPKIFRTHLLLNP